MSAGDEGRPTSMVWPPLLTQNDAPEPPPDSPLFRWDQHPHSTPEHHYHGGGVCDAACRSGQRPHRHRMLKGMATLVAEQSRPPEGSLYVEAARRRREDLDMALAQMGSEPEER